MTNVVMCFSSSDWYVPYLTTCLTSLMEYISEKNKYEIVILETEISENNKTMLNKIVNKPNCILSFFPIREFVAEKDFKCHDHVSVETFFKLFIPEIFKDKEKVLFCDADIIFQDDPAKLFDLDLKDNFLAAGLCHHWNGLMNFEKSCLNYTKEHLKMKNPARYIQGGILLFNNKKIKSHDVQNLIKLASGTSYLNHDQDVLNSWFQNKTLIFDSRWNYETAQAGFHKYAIPNMDKEHKTIWENASKNPAIIHYSGNEKPWFYPHEEFADIWWHYARKTPFYEEILKRMAVFLSEKDAREVVTIRNAVVVNQNKMMAELRNEFLNIHFPNINKHFEHCERQIKLVYIMRHLIKFNIIKSYYQIKQLFVCRNRKVYYQQKYQKLASLIEEAKKMKVNLNKY